VEVPGSIDPLCLGRAVSHSCPDGPVLTKSGRTVLLNARITQRAPCDARRNRRTRTGGPSTRRGAGEMTTTARRKTSP
jgi:hypothetical protein